MPDPTPYPTGTVTFLFTDIEGSTRLLERLGTVAYGDVLGRHQRLMRDAIEAAGGHEIKTEGDSFFVVFQSAPSAVQAAVMAQHGLAREPWWPAEVVVRVRMGLHTGEGVVARDSDYVGLDVHRAARIAAAGHGGQVLISATTRALTEDDLPAGVTLMDLGEHRLKDLSRSERIGQLVIAGLADQFPPIRTLDATPNNLPVLATSFVGRVREVAEARRLLATTRLLTLTGPGGTGKTRLALQVAAESIEDYPDGVFFVPIEPIVDPALVAPAIAAVLGVRESDQTIAVRLVEHLAPRRILLVLDNLEQVADIASLLGDLIRSGPDVRLMATSRALLHVYGEQEYPVPPLGVPDPAHLPALEALSLYEAVALFITRAMAAKPDFAVTNENAPAVAAITARLDGLPLAIELAAARVRLLSPQAMLLRLESRLALLEGGARDLPARQQTLRGAIDWSYGLLDEPGRCLFARVSVFSGGFDLESAEAICGPSAGGGPVLDVLSGLSELADQSLVRQVEEHDHVRFRMLETIREFAAERLIERGENDEIRRRHATWYTGLVEQAAPYLTSHDRAHWLDIVEHDHDNVRAALVWAVQTGDATTALRILWSTWRFWQSRAFLTEGMMHAAAVLAMPTEGVDPVLVVRGHEAAGGLAYWRGEFDACRLHYQAALDGARAIGDRKLVADELYNYSFSFFIEDPDFDRGRAAAEEAVAIYRELGDEAGLANALWGVGNSYFFATQWERSAASYTEALSLARQIGNEFMVNWSLHMLGSSETMLSRFEGAHRYLTEGTESMVRAGETTGLVIVLDDWVDYNFFTGDLERSLRLFGAARHLQEQTSTGLAEWSNLNVRGVGRDYPGIDPEARARLVAEGAALTLDDAVALALGSAAVADQPLPDSPRRRPISARQ
jgi:predicted ATPase/class 3 adenylate cyclase